jgi:PPOX class probable FMN-dependent enzyme
MMDGNGTRSRIDGEGGLRELFGAPMDLAVRKSLSALDQHCRDFIAKSPFLCIGTSSKTGRADVSPRGDPPGFVQVIDDHTLIIPDRPGNNRLDTMSNILENPAVGLLFFIPGFDDTLRINGKATIVRDEAVLARAEVNGKRPKVAIRVDIEEAFLHCAKALKRSRLWDPASRVERRTMPSLGRMILEQTAPAGAKPAEAAVAEADQLVEEAYRSNLY